MSLEKVLRLAGSPLAAQPEAGSLESELLLAARVAIGELAVFLAASGDDEETDSGKDSDSGGKDDDSDSGNDHSGHATYKALVKKNVPPKKAAAMCASADKKVKASALADSAQVILAGLSEADVMIALAAPPGESAADRKSLAARGWALEDGSYPIPDKKHLHSAAVLASSGHGNVQAAKRLIRKRASDLGVELSSLPGFGGDSDKDKKVAATALLALSAVTKPVKGTAAVAHPPYHGVHAHPHVHSGDNSHGGLSDRYAAEAG